MPVQCTCLTCDAAFTTIASRVKVGKGRYCSEPCYRAGRRSRRETRACARCEAPIDRPPSTTQQSERVYCSHACYAAHLKAEALASLREPQATRMPNGCLIFNGHKIGRGYGQVMIDGVQRQAHAVAWEVANGRPFPDGLSGCHTCDTPPCVEPTHIWPGTAGENSADRDAKGRTARGERQASAKLTDEAVRLIRARYARGEATMDRLAAEFSVGKSTIFRVVRGQHWRHVPS